MVFYYEGQTVFAPIGLFHLDQATLVLIVCGEHMALPGIAWNNLVQLTADTWPDSVH